MCILAFAKNVHPIYPLILIGNRDEFYHRPTEEAHWWETGLLAGKDLEAGGTWLGISKNGRFATVTNYRDIKGIKDTAKSRGELPVNFIQHTGNHKNYHQNIAKVADLYNGFNLLTWEKGAMYHFSNYEGSINEVEDGVHVLSNALLDTPWFKSKLLKDQFNEIIQTDFRVEDLFNILENSQKAPDEALPKTGLPFEKEKEISSICITTPDYGTCCSSALLINKENEVTFSEKLFPVGNRISKTHSFTFKIQS